MTIDRLGVSWSRREMLKISGMAGAGYLLSSAKMLAAQSERFESRRPSKDKRKFTSTVVEQTIARVKRQIADPQIAWLFENCLPNTLDTTVFPGTVDDK